jgi:hypothetical protein
MKRAWMLGLVTFFAVGASGCFPFWLFDDDDGGEPPIANPRPEPVDQGGPPSVESIDVPAWPPIGLEGRVAVAASDDRGVETVRFSFLHELERSTFGTRVEASATGLELGEGFGTLTVGVFDADGWWAERQVTDLLVDLSAPEITMGETALRAEGGELEFWVADAWVLGSVELWVDGTVPYAYEFEPGFPSTLGTAYDYSLVSVPSSLLPEGTHDATVWVFDAAGNAKSQPFVLDIDGQLPTANITSPAPGSVLSGSFEVVLSASDPGGGPVWIELRAGGTLAGTGVGPTATITLDSADFAPGPVALEAVAIDKAGNESAAASVAVTLQ